MPLLLCPNDNTAMQAVKRGDVELDICPQCRGVWLDRGELEKILSAGREERQEQEQAREGERGVQHAGLSSNRGATSLPRASPRTGVGAQRRSVTSC